MYRTLVCPECRDETILDRVQGLEGLTVDFKLSRLVELYKTMESDQSSDSDDEADSPVREFPDSRPESSRTPPSSLTSAALSSTTSPSLSLLAARPSTSNPITTAATSTTTTAAPTTNSATRSTAAAVNDNRTTASANTSNTGGRGGVVLRGRPAGRVDPATLPGPDFVNSPEFEAWLSQTPENPSDIRPFDRSNFPQTPFDDYMDSLTTEELFLETQYSMLDCLGYDISMWDTIIDRLTLNNDDDLSDIPRYPFGNRVTTDTNNADNIRNNNVGDLGNNDDDLGNNVGDLDNNADDLGNNADDLRNNVGDFRNIIGDLRNNISDIRNNFGELRNDISDLRNNIGDLGNNVNDQSSLSSEYTSSRRSSVSVTSEDSGGDLDGWIQSPSNSAIPVVSSTNCHSTASATITTLDATSSTIASPTNEPFRGVLCDQGHSSGLQGRQSSLDHQTREERREISRTFLNSDYNDGEARRGDEIGNSALSELSMGNAPAKQSFKSRYRRLKKKVVNIFRDSFTSSDSSDSEEEEEEERRRREIELQRIREEERRQRVGPHSNHGRKCAREKRKWRMTRRLMSLIVSEDSSSSSDWDLDRPDDDGGAARGDDKSYPKNGVHLISDDGDARICPQEISVKYDSPVSVNDAFHPESHIVATSTTTTVNNAVTSNASWEGNKRNAGQLVSPRVENDIGQQTASAIGSEKDVGSSVVCNIGNTLTNNDTNTDSRSGGIYSVELETILTSRSPNHAIFSIPTIPPFLSHYDNVNQDNEGMRTQSPQPSLPDNCSPCIGRQREVTLYDNVPSIPVVVTSTQMQSPQQSLSNNHSHLINESGEVTLYDNVLSSPVAVASTSTSPHQQQVMNDVRVVSETEPNFPREFVIGSSSSSKRRTGSEEGGMTLYDNVCPLDGARSSSEADGHDLLPPFPRPMIEELKTGFDKPGETVFPALSIDVQSDSLGVSSQRDVKPAPSNAAIYGLTDKSSSGRQSCPTTNCEIDSLKEGVGGGTTTPTCPQSVTADSRYGDQIDNIRLEEISDVFDDVDRDGSNCCDSASSETRVKRDQYRDAVISLRACVARARSQPASFYENADNGESGQFDLSENKRRLMALIRNRYRVAVEERSRRIRDSQTDCKRPAGSESSGPFEGNVDGESGRQGGGDLLQLQSSKGPCVPENNVTATAAAALTSSSSTGVVTSSSSKDGVSYVKLEDKRNDNNNNDVDADSRKLDGDRGGNSNDAVGDDDDNNRRQLDDEEVDDDDEDAGPNSAMLKESKKQKSRFRQFIKSLMWVSSSSSSDDDW